MAFSMKRCSSNGQLPIEGGARAAPFNGPARESRDRGAANRDRPEYWKPDRKRVARDAILPGRRRWRAVCHQGGSEGPPPIARRPAQTAKLSQIRPWPPGVNAHADRNNCGMTSTAALMTKGPRSHASVRLGRPKEAGSQVRSYTPLYVAITH